MCVNGCCVCDCVVESEWEHFYDELFLYYIDKMLRLRVERCALRKEIAE